MSGVERASSREIALWVISGAVVLALHGGAAGVLAAWSEFALPGVPQSAVLLDLSSMAAAPAAPKSDIAPSDKDSQFVEPVPEPLKKIEKEELEPPKEVTELTPEPPQKVVEPQPEPVPQPPPEPPLQKPAEVVLPTPAPPPPKPAQQKQRTASIDARRVHQDTVSDKVSAASAGAIGTAKATYNQQIVAHLNRNKVYPAAARSSGVEGVVTLSFVLNRSGNVIASHIARGSGHSELDREALAMLKRAQPFPTPPSELAAAQFPFTAPMRYNLNQR